MAEAVIRHLVSAERYSDAAAFAKDHAEEFANDADYLLLWARAVAHMQDGRAASQFLEDRHVDLEAVREGSAGTLVKLLRTAGRDTEALDIEGALDEAVGRHDYDELFSLAEENAQRGLAGRRRFESAVRRGLPESAGEFLLDVRRTLPACRPVRPSMR